MEAIAQQKSERRMFSQTNLLVGLLLPCVVLLTCVATGLLAQQPPAQQPANRPPESPRTLGTSAKLLRQGALLKNVSGTFRKTGVRIAFHQLDSDKRFIVLENLSLQRVSNVLREQGDSMIWRVYGTVQEYHSANYILLERVILTGKQHEEK